MVYSSFSASLLIMCLPPFSTSNFHLTFSFFLHSLRRGVTTIRELTYAILNRGFFLNMTPNLVLWEIAGDLVDRVGSFRYLKNCFRSRAVFEPEGSCCSMERLLSLLSLLLKSLYCSVRCWHSRFPCFHGHFHHSQWSQMVPVIASSPEMMGWLPELIQTCRWLRHCAQVGTPWVRKMVNHL